MRPIILPPLSASEAQALSAIARHGSRLLLSGWKWGSEAPVISVSVSTGQTLWEADQAQRLELDWAGAKLYLDFPGSAMHSWVSTVLGGAELSVLPPQWQKAAQLQACEWIASSLSQAGRGKARIQQLDALPSTAPAAARHRFILQMHFAAQPDTVIYAVLHTDSLGLLLLSGFIASHGSLAPAHETPSLPLPLQLCLGETDLPLQQLQSLQHGDVIFLTRPFIQNRQQLYLRNASPNGPRWGIPASLDGITLHILQAPHTMATSDTSVHSVATDASDAEFSLEQIPICLSFDVGSKTVSLQELQTMQPGQVLNLERPLQEYVTIRANGAAVGSGQLVEIDGRLGVMVASLRVAKP
jgi:type III secretion protein Q